MNKLIIGKSIINIDNNDDYFLEIDKDINVTVNVKENINAKLVIINNGNSLNIKINLYKDSNLIINSLNKDVNNNIEINLLEENSKIIYNHSVVSNNDSITNYKINHLSSKTKSIINNNGVNLNNNRLYFNVDGIIKKNSKDVFIDQKNKIINIKNGDSKIIPNFIIDNNEIVANHSAYIGNFSYDDIFYIKSRGISEEEMYRLLYRSLLLGNMDLSFEQEIFNKILKEWRVL